MKIANIRFDDPKHLGEPSNINKGNTVNISYDSSR
jgi:hypothetical protein